MYVPALSFAMPRLPTVMSPVYTPGLRVTVELVIVCPPYTGTPVVVGPASEAKGSAAAGDGEARAARQRQGLFCARARDDHRLPGAGTRETSHGAHRYGGAA